LTETVRAELTTSLSQKTEGRLGFFGSLVARFRGRATSGMIGIIA
jgi:hypothetical protein